MIVSRSQTIYIPCRVSPGLFRDERVVEFEVEGQTCRAVVDKRDVLEPDCFLRVHVLEQSADRVLVDLPRETVTTRQQNVRAH